jgi:hypothetical protein
MAMIKMEISTDAEVKEYREQVAACEAKNHSIYKEASSGGPRFPGQAGSGIVGILAICQECKWSKSIRLL